MKNKVRSDHPKHAPAGASGSSPDSSSSPIAPASASDPTTETSHGVKISPHPIVSTQVLLELAIWCQHRLAIMEEHQRRHGAEPDPQAPPAQVAPTALPDDSLLAPADVGAPDRPVEPDDRAAASPSRPRRSPRKKGGR
jgi:hypothetical protein